MNSPASHQPPRINKNRWIVAACVIGFFVLTGFARSWLSERAADRADARKNSQTQTAPSLQRLVGLSPSIVETLYAMGLGDRVVAISRYSTYPPEALDLPKISGLADVDFEQLLILQPDHVVMLNSQNGLVKKFDELGVPTLSLDHASVDGIIDGFNQIAEVCGNHDQAQSITAHMLEHIAAVKGKVQGKTRPRVLVCIHHSTDVSQPEQIVACGNAGYHQELINIAGGVNAYEGAVAYPKLSRENLINLNPDIIIDLVNHKVAQDRSKQDLVQLWDVYSELKAVRTKRIVIADGPQHFLPGPRFLDTLDVFLEGIHGIQIARPQANEINTESKRTE